MIDLKALEEEYGKDEGHGWPHVSRVRSYCLLISKNYHVDIEVLEYSALLHDISRDGSGDHGLDSSHEAVKRLRPLGIEESQLILIAKCIFEHNKTSMPSSTEGKILQDSDKLDCLGAVGLIRIIRHQNDLGPRELIEHMKGWELEWPGRLWTVEAEAIASKRVPFLWDFVSRIESELEFLGR